MRGRRQREVHQYRGDILFPHVLCVTSVIMSVAVVTEILVAPYNTHYAAFQILLLLFFSSGNFPKGFLCLFFFADSELIKYFQWRVATPVCIGRIPLSFVNAILLFVLTPFKKVNYRGTLTSLSFTYSLYHLPGWPLTFLIIICTFLLPVSPRTLIIFISDQFWEIIISKGVNC